MVSKQCKQFGFRFFSGGVLLFLLVSCAPSEKLNFQKTVPTSGVKLTEVLDSVPVLEEMFSNIDQDIFNEKLAEFLDYDPETSVFMLNQLYHLIRVNYHLPKLLEDTSGILDMALEYYQDDKNQTELSQIGTAFNNLSQSQFVAFLDIAKKSVSTLSKAVHSIGNNPFLFLEASNDPFVSLGVWSDCSVSNEDFEEAKPSSNSEKRELLYQFYSLSRMIHCGMAELSDQDIGIFFDESTGKVREMGATGLIDLFREIDIEAGVDKFVDLMKNHKDEIIEIDREMSEWLVSSPPKVNLLNHAIDYLYPVLLSGDKTALYKEGAKLLDNGVGFLTVLTPDSYQEQEGRYLIEWLLNALYSDLEKVSDLKNLIELELDAPVYNKLKSIIGNNVHEGIRSVFKNTNLGYSKSKLRRFLDSGGFSFTPANADYATQWKGLFYDGLDSDSDGLLKRFSRVTHGSTSGSNNSYYGEPGDYGGSTFRRLMKQRLGSALGHIQIHYENEAPLEAFIKNFYYGIVDEYYSASNRTWKTDRVQHGSQTLPVYLSRLQYSFLNLMQLNADGRYVEALESSAPSRPVRPAPFVPSPNAYVNAIRKWQYDNAMSAYNTALAAWETFSEGAAVENSKKVPYITHFLHTLAGAMGYLDPEKGAARQTLKHSLEAVGSTDIAEDGVQTTKKDGQTVHAAVMCDDDKDPELDGGYKACKVLENSIARNGHPYMLSSKMPAYELLTPGRFLTRNNKWAAAADRYAYDFPEGDPTLPRHKGKFSPHQGDLISTGARTAEWAMAQFQFFGWFGYGPYTVKGKAPNGGVLKYANTFVTDSYKARLCEGGTHHNDLFVGKCKNGRYKFYPLGNGASYVGLNNSSLSETIPDLSKEGAIRMYENIYRPKKSTDPCWNNAGGGPHGYTRYAYLRPSKNTSYSNNSSCFSWTKIQVDFDSRERAIAENIKWLIYYKKLVLITPNAIFGNKHVALNHHGASMAIFNIAVGNGLQGLISAKLAGEDGDDDNDGCWPARDHKYKCNGVWNSDVDYNMMDASDDDGEIPLNDNGKGFRNDAAGASERGIKRLIHFGRTSFQPGDSALIVDFIVNTWGFAKHNDTQKKIFTNIPRPDTDFTKALAPLLSLAKEYVLSDITWWSGKTINSFGKFQYHFYAKFFPEDIYTRVGKSIQPGGNGVPDILDKFEMSKHDYPGCRDSNNKRVPLCLTGIEMPYVPRVRGVSYPSAYDSDGNVTAWEVSDHSELKFSAFVSLLTQMMGTFHEAGRIVGYGVSGRFLEACVPEENVTMWYHPDSDFRDLTESLVNKGLHCIEYFAPDGFRPHIRTFLTALVSLNETKQVSETGENSVLPEYNYDALLNKLIESAPGQRDGPIMVALRDLNLANLPSFRDDIQPLFNQGLESVLTEFKLLDKEGGANSNLNKLRFFLTKNVVKEGAFPSNFLGQGQPTDADFSSSKEPLLMLKEDLLPYLRKLTSDQELEKALVDTIDLINDFLVAEGKAPINLTSEQAASLFENIKEFLNKRNSDGAFLLDNILQKLYDSGYHNLSRLYDLDIFEILDELPELAEQIKDVFTYDVEAEIFGKLFSDHRCNGNAFLDINGDSNFDEKMLLFHRNSYEFTDSQCRLKDRLDYYSPSRYLLNIKHLAGSINQGMNDLDSEAIGKLLDGLYSLRGLDEEITGLKDEAIDKVMEKDFTEVSFDLNGNGSIDGEDEYLDFDGDGSLGKFKISNAIEFSQSKMKEYLLEEDGSQMVLKPNMKGILSMMNELFNPQNPECLSKTENCLYMTSTLIQLQSEFSSLLKFTPEDLRAFKNLAANFVYDRENNQPTNLLFTSSHSLAPIMLAFRGKYKKLLDVMDYSLQPEGFMTFMSDSMKLPEGYETTDLLGDVQILLDTRVMREYKDPATFWWQFGELIGGFADLAARRHGYSWETEEDYYNRMSDIFTENEATGNARSDK